MKDKVTIFVGESYTTSPEKWAQMTDEQMIYAFNYFYEWFIIREEQMTLENAELGWKVLEAWYKACVKRGIDTNKLDFTPSEEESNV